MQFTLLSPEAVEAEWPDIAERLAPVLGFAPDYDADLFRARVMRGAALLFEVGGEVNGLVGLMPDAAGAVWIDFVVGLAGGRRNLRAAMARIEQAARGAGFHTLKFVGRPEWRRVFPEYRPIPGLAGGLERSL